jgi:hypothetical protein
MTAKHTPGPWKAIRALIVMDVAERPVIAQMCDPAGSYHEMQANARLIAAAPDMLEALTKIIAATEDGDEMGAVEMALAAIAKAT